MEKTLHILVVGQGGREHAMARALRASPRVASLHALPGSDGIAPDATCHAVDWRDFNAVRGVVQANKINLVVIGPDNIAATDLADRLRAQGVAVFAPSQAAARLEASKVFSKQFMMSAGIPTARAVVVTSVEEVRARAREFTVPFVLKADGLALGKGVFICRSESELLAAAHSLFVDRALGEAGAKALLEEFHEGYELSFHVLTNGEDFEPLALAQDHKRLGDGDRGPNTGGMGTIAPVAVEDALRERIYREVMWPTVRAIKQAGLIYRGVIFVGLMVTRQGPIVIEYNVRFGDPETQVILPLLDGDWALVLAAVADGKMPRLKWKNAAAACVVLAAQGYPDQPVKGAAIRGLSASGEAVGDGAPGALHEASAYVLHAGSQRRADDRENWQTSGGRVLNLIGLGADLRSALRAAYLLTEKVSWPGVQFRRDIGGRSSHGADRGADGKITKSSAD